MGKIVHELFPAIFGALLLICLCHSTKLNSSSDSKLNLFNVNPSNVSDGRPIFGRKGRCLGFLKRWIGLGTEEIISGDPNEVRFFLYPNPRDKNYAEEIKFGDTESLKKAHFQPGLQLKIVIHGFTKNYTDQSIQMVKNSYLARMETSQIESSSVNVILVDWEPLGNPNVKNEGLFYRMAVGNVPVVGKRVGEFIQFLVNNGLVRSLKDVHIIGFSLGAHVAGNAGNTLRELNAGRVPARVTGLDPAGPAFYEELSFSHRSLHKMDGRFVDVIHTNMGAMGTINALGHADFYPNGGGPNQHRCEVEYEQKKAHGANDDGGIWDTKLLSVTSCSHNKAPEFFALSILNPHMVACKCESYIEFKSHKCPCNEVAIFGEYCDSRTRGKFYLDV